MYKNKITKLLAVAIVLSGMVFVPLTTNAQSTSGDSITITEQAGQTTQNYPIQMGRPFAQGEIATAPVAVIDGVAIQTQADIKLRWPDGSVKFAVLAFYIPELKANSSVNVVFQNQTSPNNTPPSIDSLLSSDYDFDAVINISKGSVTKIASARSMLQGGNFTYWTQGPIATTLILADHTNRKYDMGFDSYKSIRPIFEATFWPAKKIVQVRFIGENANTESLEDVTYNLNLTLGKTNPGSVYQESGVVQRAATRWTKLFWEGGVPGKISINHNLAYLISTKFLPSYDTTKQYSNSVLQSAYSNWQGASKNLFSSGTMQKYMPSSGGREDIGMYPAWVVRWIYSFSPGAEEESLGNADLGGSWPIHFREGDSSKMYDKDKTISAVGKPISLSARPTIYLFHPEAGGINPQDAINYVGANTDGGFVADNAHQPELYSIPYLLTGDFWYLEQLQFWSAWSAVTQSFATDRWWGRGPTGAEGGMHDQTRGEAWALRTRMLASLLSPDGTAEKKYFTSLTNDLIAIWDGERNITGTQFDNSANWNWGRSVGAMQFPGSVPSPLHAWMTGSDRAVVSGNLDASKTSSGTAPWEYYYLLSSLGRGQEMGFDTGPLVNWLGQFLIGETTDTGYDPAFTAVSQMPVLDTKGNWFTNWGDVKLGFSSDLQKNPMSIFTYNSVDPDGYAYYARGAATFLTNTSAGQNTFNILSQMLGSNPVAWNKDLKWAITPRVYTSISPAPSVIVPTTPVVSTPQTPVSIQPLPSGVSNKFVTGSLVNDNGTIYLIVGKNKKAFASASVFLSLGYSFNQAVAGDTSNYTQNYIIKYSSAGHPFGAWVKNGRAYYFVHDTGLIPIPTWDVFLGFTNNSVPVPNMVPADKNTLKAKVKITPLSYPDARVY